MYVVRSGRPKVLRLTAIDGASATEQQYTFLNGCVTTWIQIHNRGTNGIKVYFTVRDLEAGVGYIEIAAGDKQEMPIEIGGPNSLIGLFIVGVGGDSDITLFFAERIA